MFENLDVFKIAHAMASHAGQRQAIISQNVANADTPGFKSRDLPDFKSSYTGENQTGLQKATRDKHLHGTNSGIALNAFEEKSIASPDGNSVSIETEMLKATEVSRQHNRALAIYKSSLDILHKSLGRR